MTVPSSTSRGASAQEWMIWRRLASDPADPGLVLSYVFALPEGVALDRLSGALARLVTEFQPGLSSRFFTKGYALRVRTVPACGDPLARGADEWPFGTRPVIDPRDGPLYRFETRQDERGGISLRLSFSHLILDGRGYAVVRRDLDRAYRGAVPGSVEPRADGPAVTDEALAYWRSYLDRTSLYQPLAFLRRPASDTREADAEVFACPYGADWFARRTGSAFQLVCAATALLVRRYNGSFGEDGPVRIAYTVGLGDGGTAGTHANVASLIADPQAALLAADFLDGIRADRRRARPHQHIPFADIAAMAGRSDGPLANLIVNHSPGLLPAEGLSLDGLDCPLVRGPEAGGPYDLAVVYDLRADHLAVRLEIRRGAAPPETRAALARAWRRCLDFLAEAAEGGTRTLGELDLSRPIRNVAAGPARETPPLDPRRRIAAVAAADPDRVATGDRGGTTSYGALLGQVDALALRLARLPETRRQAGIAFLLPRDRVLPVAYLAAIEASIRFAPIDPALPDPAILGILEISGIRTVLTTGGFAARLDFLSAAVDLDRIEIDASLAPPEEAGIAASVDRDDAADAYLMFTSGSTGVPKGVAVTRRNLSNLLQSMAGFAFAERDSRWLALTAVGFDISILELLLPLTCGASVHVADEEARISARSIARCIDDWRIDTLQATPSTFEMLRRDGWRARRPLALLCGGEALSEHLAEFLLGQGHGLFNVYGPTEATIWATCSAVVSARDPSIGGPLDNTRLYVCDPEGSAVPCGMAGELVLSGAQVARGYLNAPNAPAYGADPASSGERAYRTGDRVVHRGAGRLDFLGRLDDQIKLSGHRIELGEVRAAVAAAAGAPAFCVLRRTPGDHIACFVGPGRPDAFDLAAVRQRVNAFLPEWKRPSHYHLLSAVPLTPNGKADLKRLARAPLADLPVVDPSPHACESPDVDSLAASAVPDAPADPSLAALIETATGRAPTDPTASLVDNGFGSLDFNRLSAAIERASGVVIPPHRFFAFRDLRALERAVAQATGATPAPDRSSATGGSTGAAGAPTAGSDPVAILGMSGRGPGGLDIDGLMQAYEEGRSLIQPGDRLAGRALLAGLIDDVEAFDARFFGISPVEARHMDPRQRILLEECWRCLEDANVLPRDLTGARVGCYVGVTGSDFTTLSERAGTAPHPYALSGTAASIVANRISSFFDWRGPSMAIDTACSSGLTALVRALSDLAAGLCEQAFVASANLVLDERLDAALEAGGFLSKSGRCSAFRDEADGYVRADGVFGIFLKPLSRARTDGDRVRAVIRAAEDGHGGRAASLTAPSAESQAVLLARAWRDGIGRAIGYVETHGTGTRLGDPIEIDGLKGAMASVAPERSDAVYLGALKANAGHAEASAGLAGLAKVVRILETGRIPPNRAPGAPNPFIDVTAGPFRFPDRAIAFPTGAFSDEAETGSSQEMPRNQGPRERRDCSANVKCSRTQEEGRPRRVAGVSSFGFGGSNVHVVLEAWPEEEDGRAGAEARRARPSLVVLSARSAGSLQRQAARLADALESEPAASLAAVARTLALHRTHFEYRAAFLAPNREALSRWLRSAFEIAEPGRPVTGAALHPGSPTGLHAASSGDDPAPALRAFLAGEAVDFGPLFRSRADPDGPRPQRLPGYAFDRDQVFPLPCPSSRRTADPAVPSSGEPARDEAPYVLTGGGDRRVEIRLGSARRLFSRHRVNGSGVLPGVAGLLLAEDAFRRVHPSSPSRLALCDVGWPLAIGADDAEAPIVVEIGGTDRGSTFAVSICGEERLFGAVAEPSTRVPRIAPDFANWQRRQWALDRAAPSEVEALYRRFADQGIDYDGEFRCLRHVERSGTRCRAVLERRNPDWNGLVGLLDGALQSGLALSADGMGGALMPFSLGALIWHRPAHTIEAGTFHAMTLRSSRFRTQIQLCDSRLEPVAAFVDLGVRPKPAGPATSETTHLETAS